MPVPKPPIIELTDNERGELDALMRRHSTPQQLALRARIVLAASDGLNNGQIVRELGVSRDTMVSHKNQPERLMACLRPTATAPSHDIRDIP